MGTVRPLKQKAKPRDMSATTTHTTQKRTQLIKKATFAKAACGLLLLALVGAACANDKPQVVTTPGDTNTTLVDQGAQIGVDPSVPGDPDATAATATTATGTEVVVDSTNAPDPNQPTTSGPPEEVPGVVDTTDTSATTQPSQPPATTTPLATIESPFAGQVATIMIANGQEQRQVPLYETPGGREISLPDNGLWYRSYHGNPLVMQVLEGQESDAWVRVSVSARQPAPERTCTVAPCYKNGVEGWVENNGYNWTKHQYFGIIDLSERSVRLWNDDTLVAQSRAVIGRPSRETPLGTFFLKEKLPPPNAAYGQAVLSLSGFSEQLRDFQGGLPQIALHGTNRPELVGQAVSSGCIRVPNSVITTIRDSAPLGTIFEVRA